jgi:putative MATE family efflux protein
MKLDLTYRQIWRISAPIMLGSAAQNVIALSDAVLLYHLSESDFAAIGFVGVFYIVIAAIGYSFSRGGQIIIARRMGEGQPHKVGQVFHTMLLFELVLALLMWLVMHFGASYIFPLFINHSPEVNERCLAYIQYRSYGVFFSYAGVAIISLYTGIARPVFILVDTIILAIVNLVLNVALIFGKMGFEPMGIAGSGLASTIAEAIAFVIFVVYMLLDRANRPLRIFTWPQFDWALMRQQLRISLPVVAQAIVGQGSWLFFFGLVENYGARALAVSNLARNVYLLISIPLWGFSAGANTLISNLIGQRRYADVLPATLKISKLCWLVTAVLGIPILTRPEFFLYPLLGKSDMSLIGETQPIFYLMIGLLALSVLGTISFNALAGTGATWFGLKVQFFSVATYISYLYYACNYARLGLPWVWAAEVLYWLVMLLAILWYLRSEQWHQMEV